jgi:trehalose 6-phosphate phosphatase
MKDILASGNLAILEQVTWSRLLVALDYDGTLAPIVGDPSRASMRPRTRDLLARLASLYEVVVISGRGHADIRKRLEGVPVAAVVGNHGVEPHRASSPYVAEVRRWLPALQAALQPLRGVELENKTFSVAVHYRRSREKKRAKALILAAASSLGDVRVIHGNQVANLLPVGAPHKGIALERERDRLGCDTAIYVGDDETDEDVFMLDQPGRLLTIRVGARRTSAADYCIANQGAIDELLDRLIQLREQVRPLRVQRTS